VAGGTDRGCAGGRVHDRRHCREEPEPRCPEAGAFVQLVQELGRVVRGLLAPQ
jgi:hypothetical protein